jgi:hypothetical protein
MANFNLTPNMNLPNAVPGVDPGPDYADNNQDCFNILDQHNHSPGSGVQINPSGILINADLPFNDNNATTLRSVRFQVQASALSLATDLGCLYVTGVDLWFNDENGNQIQLTKGGVVNATSSGISSGTASASFVAGVLVVDSAPTTPANIQVGSILLGNNTPGSNFLTLSPPSAMPANYQITLPFLPASNLPMSLSSTGTITAAQITTSQIANLAVTDAQIANATITQDKLAVRATGVTVGVGGIAISASGGGTVGGSFTVFCTVTITTTGSPVMLLFQSDGTTGGSYAQAANTGSVLTVAFFNGATQQATYLFDTGAGRDIINPSCTYIDTPVAGTYTYTVQAVASSFAWNLSAMELVAYEL